MHLASGESFGIVERSETDKEPNLRLRISNHSKSDEIQTTRESFDKKVGEFPEDSPKI